MPLPRPRQPINPPPQPPFRTLMLSFSQSPSLYIEVPVGLHLKGKGSLIEIDLVLSSSLTCGSSVGSLNTSWYSSSSFLITCCSISLLLLHPKVIIHLSPAPPPLFFVIFLLFLPCPDSLSCFVLSLPATIAMFTKCDAQIIYLWIICTAQRLICTYKMCVPNIREHLGHIHINEQLN